MDSSFLNLQPPLVCTSVCICMFPGLILALCLPLHFKLSAFRYHLPARRSACPYLPESALQGCPCPARVPLCQTFISQHPNGSVTQHKPSSVTRRRRRQKKRELPHGFMEKFVFVTSCHDSITTPVSNIYYELLTYITASIFVACYVLQNVPGKGAIWLVSYVSTCQHYRQSCPHPSTERSFSSSARKTRCP